MRILPLSSIMSRITEIYEQAKEVLQGEVPKEILDQLEILKKALTENKKLAGECGLKATDEDFRKLDEDTQKTTRYLNEQKCLVNKELVRGYALTEKVTKDYRMAAQVLHRHQALTKDPQYGRMQAMEYMHDVAGQHEQNLDEYEVTLDRLEQLLNGIQQDSDVKQNEITEADLKEHVRRFDEIYSVVAAQAYAANEEVQKLKDSYLENWQKVFGRYANPFQPNCPLR
uniref:Uncharacterized protein n=1 Tax=Ditylenchus dipsaci TaxID=166011 RepID=A0A915E6S1_9BILA